MPNPYHDATGKFCSRDQMQNAIDQAAEAKDFALYTSLREDFKAAEKDQVVISRELFSRVARSGLVIKTDNPDEIKLVFDELKEELTKPGSYKHSEFKRLLSNPNTPVEVREEILTKIDEHTKADWFYNSSSSETFLTPQEVTLMAQNLQTTEAQHAMFRNNKLTYEQKYQFATQSLLGLSTLASSDTKLFFSNPDLSEELYGQREKITKLNDSSTEHTYLRTLAHSPVPEHQRYVLEKGKTYMMNPSSPYGKLASNPNLSEGLRTQLLRNTAENDIDFFSTAASDIEKTAWKNGNYRVASFSRLVISHRAPTKGETPKDLYKAQDTIKSISLTPEPSRSSAESAKLESAQAYVDSFPEGWKALEKEYKEIQKQKRKFPTESAEAELRIKDRFTRARVASAARAYLSGN